MEPATRHIYVLRLKGGKYYVGSTGDVSKRFAEHLAGEGAEWTRVHEPLDVSDSWLQKDEFEEDTTVKKYMALYGIENVRGGSYCQIHLPEDSFRVLQRELRGRTNACYTCGEQGHFANKCPHRVQSDERARVRVGAQYHQMRCPRPEAISRVHKNASRTANGVCFRCGWPGHVRAQCFAKTHRNGNVLDQ